MIHRPYPDPCKTCKYSKQACAYVLGGEQEDDSCVDKLRWLRYNKRHSFNNEPIVIEVKPGDDIRLMVPGNTTTCVYISLYNGKLTITGGSSIIDSIDGKNMSEKIISGEH